MSLESSIARRYLQFRRQLLALLVLMGWTAAGIGLSWILLLILRPFLTDLLISLPPKYFLILLGSLGLLLSSSWGYLGVRLWWWMMGRPNRKDQPFMSGLLVWVGVWGVAVSVFALILVQAVMAGFSQDLHEKILKLSPSITLTPLSEDYLGGKKAPSVPPELCPFHFIDYLQKHSPSWKYIQSFCEKYMKNEGAPQESPNKTVRFGESIVALTCQKYLSEGRGDSENSCVRSLSPYLETEVIIHMSDEQTQGAKLRGISTSDSRLFERLHAEFGRDFGWKDLSTQNEELPGILLGSELAKRLNVIPDLEEEVELIYPFGEVDPTGEMRPKTRHFRVIGTFKTGYYDYDNKFIIADLSEARRLVPIHEVPTSWGVWLKNFSDSQRMARGLSQSLHGDFKVEGWGERNQKLFSALRFERLAMFLVLAIMTAIATFNIFSLTMMMVVSKTKEIAVFRALGMERKRVQRIFSGIGLTLGILGTLLGFLLGLGAVLYLRWKPLAVPSSYYLESLPVKLEPLFILLVILVTPFLALLAAWYPARRGGRFDIAESLRYE